MPRKNLIRSDVFPYHVTGRTNNRERFCAPMDDVWRIMTNELYLLTITQSIEIQCFVLMPNHFHLILTVPKEDLGKIMELYMSAVTKALNRHMGKTGRVFGGPYFWSIITSSRYYGHAFKYIYRNPVRGRICEQVEQYEFSTLRGLVGLAPLPFPITYTRPGMEINLPENEETQRWLDWLNQPFPLEAEKRIAKVLRRKELKDENDRDNRKPDDLLSQLW